MPDNRELIRKHLGKLGLDPSREEEIIRELSEHLTDQSATLEGRGVASVIAVQKALDSVPNWAKFRKEIKFAEMEEAIMNHRTKVLWLPALASLTLSSLVLAILQFSGVVPHFYWVSGAGYTFFTFYVPWLIALPAIGAIAAFWSQHAGGRTIHRLLAAVAPSLGLLGFLLVAPFLTLLVYECLRLFAHDSRYRVLLFPPSPFHAPPAVAFLVFLASWILLPAVGLFLGATPFLRHPQPHS